MGSKRRSRNQSGSSSKTKEAKRAKFSVPENSLFFETLNKAGLTVHSDGCKLSQESSAFQQKLSKMLTGEDSITEFVTSMEEGLEQEQMFFSCLLPTEVCSSSDADELFPTAISSNQMQVGN